MSPPRMPVKFVVKRKTTGSKLLSLRFYKIEKQDLAHEGAKY